LSLRLGSAVSSMVFTRLASSLKINSPSRRAIIWPTQAWMPAPKPTCPVAFDVEAVWSVPARGVAIGGGHEQQHLAVCGDHAAADLDIARGGAKERLHRRIITQPFLERVAGQLRLVVQLASAALSSRTAPGKSEARGRVSAGAGSVPQNPPNRWSLSPRGRLLPPVVGLLD
jgi:hypothetical protein